MLDFGVSEKIDFRSKICSVTLSFWKELTIWDEHPTSEEHIPLKKKFQMLRVTKNFHFGSFWTVFIRFSLFRNDLSFCLPSALQSFHAQLLWS